jgi:outer membrane receptor protein involved in Fe transport
MTRSGSGARFGGAAALLLLSGSGVQAQTQSVATVDNGTIETVVVTAAKRSESSQSIAGGITAMTGADLAQMHANTLTDFAGMVPSLAIESNGPTNNIVSIRGVTTGSTQLGSAVALYVDEVPVGASTQFGLGAQSLNINLFDMNRVEVLDGPQGTLYGANALGGALKYVTAAPDLNAYDALGEVEGSSTAHGGYNDDLRAMANIPFMDGQAALRLDGVQEADTGYTQDPDHGRSNVGGAHSLGGRASFLVDLSPDLDIRLSAASQDVKGYGADVVLKDFLTHRPVAGTYDQSYALAQPSDNALDLYSAVVNWNLHWAKLTSVTGYQYNYGSYTLDVTPLYDTLFALYGFPFGATPFGLPVKTSTKKFTQELRLASPDNHNFEWVVGGYFDREITDESVNLVDGATPSGNVPYFNTLPFYGNLPSTYREFAVFADGTYYVTDRFDVTLGIRYSQQDQHYSSYISSLLFGPPFGVVYPFKNSSNQGVETYLINPRFQLTDDTMLYARASSGYRPGGPNFVLPSSFGSTAAPTFNPDNLWNYELGEKTKLFDGRALFNFDIYDIEWTSIQTTANFGGINQLVNAGNARIEGAETSFEYRVLHNLDLGGTASYTDGFLTTPSAVLGTSKGAQLPLSARYQFALNGTYTFDLPGNVGGALNVSDVYVGSRDAGYNVAPAGLAVGRGTPLYKLGAYNTVNLNLAMFLSSNVELDAYMKNAFDVRGELSASTGNDEYLNPYFLHIGIPYEPVPVELSQPRTIGLVLKVGLDH